MKKHYEPLYVKAFERHLQAIHTQDLDLSDRQLMNQTILYAVRYYNAVGKRYASQDELEVLLAEYDALFTCMMFLTPVELTRLFPIEKEYDGDKWQQVDYFSTMAELEHIGMNTPIGEHLIPLTMSYHNDEVRHLIVRHTTLLSALLRYNGQEGLAERWADSIGLDMYYQSTDEESGASYLVSRNAMRCLSAAAGHTDFLG